MRTTINIEDDVLSRAKRIATKREKSLRYILNEALREGLAFAEVEAEKKPYTMESRNMELKAGYNLDNIRSLLS